MRLVNMYVLMLLALIFPASRLHSQLSEDENTVVWFRLAADKGINEVISTLHDADPASTATLRLLFPNHQHTQELSGIYEVVFRNSHLSDAALLRMHKLGAVAFAEKKPVIRSLYTPNDLLATQWHLTKIRAEDAWDIARGSAGVTVAVVDDFFDLTHPDLQGVWQLNAGEIPGNNTDDDGNGYIDDYYGWNANYNHPHVMPPVLRRAQFSHGTHCAGIVGARTDNGVGIASIGFGLKILAVAVGDSINPGRMGNAYQGVVYAADRGARIISLSWGSYASSITGQQVINYAHNKGAIVFAAAGNDNTDIPVYPAGYNHVVAVAATDVNDIKSSFSNYGTWVDLSAPGSAILSTITGATPAYGNMSGTSMATPLTAGLAGLMLSHNPQLTAADLEAILKKTALNHYAVNSTHTGKLGTGRIDAAKAVQSILKLKALFTENKRSICPKDTVKFQFSGYGSSLSYRWSFPGGNPSSQQYRLACRRVRKSWPVRRAADHP
jgi:serine protease